MALSGKITTNSYDGRYYVLSWGATPSIATNTSVITWKLSCAGSSGAWYAERTLKAVIAGKTVVNKTDRVERYDGSITSGSFTVTHDTQGDYSFSASLQVACYYSTVNLTASGNFILDTIARYGVITAAPNFYDEDDPTITYSNPTGNNVTSLQACIANPAGKVIYASYRDISKTGTSYIFELTETERETLRNACTTANSMKVKFYIKTVISGNTFYSTAERTLSIINAEPVITSATVEDVNELTLAVTGDNQTLIKGCSTVEVSMAVTLQKGATIVGYEIKNGYTTIDAASGSFQDVESGVFIFSVTDSRGNRTQQTITLDIIDYIKLTCDLYAKAPDAEGNLKFTITGNCFAGAFGDMDNQVQVLMRYAENGGTYSNWMEIETRLGMDHKYTAEVNMSGFDYQNRYTFQAQAYDLLNTVITNEQTVKCIPIFDWGENDFRFHVAVMFNGDMTVLDADGNEFSLIEKVLELEQSISAMQAQNGGE